MSDCTKVKARIFLAAGLGAAFLGFAAVISPSLSADAQQTAIISRGDAAVTAFSGARQLGEVPAGVHPLDVTFIDVAGAVLQVFDLTKLGAAPTGQVANAPIKFQAAAGEIGQVFGVTLDAGDANATPNIYATSTSLFGLQIVSANGERLARGEPGARWMPGQFGLEKGGTPGSVWKIDGTTGAVSLFANVTQDGKNNAGPGLGAITYDPATKQFFVSDLETGLIHRLGLDGGDRGTFDHGTTARTKAGLDPVPYDAARRMNIEDPGFDIEDPRSWGFATKGRSVFAVAVQGGRLYYSVAEGPQIWSVGLNADGSFADDPRLEIDVTGTPAGNVITGIVFDGAGTIYLAQRGEIVGSYDYSVFAKPDASSVLRYAWNDTERRWSAQAEEYAIGLKDPFRSTEGGIALNYGYDATGNIDYGQCRATLWTTGEHLREGEDSDRINQGGARIVHGLQGNDKSKVRPANVPPFDSWFVDNDGLFVDSNVFGYIGDIAIFNSCEKPSVAAPTSPPFPVPLPQPVPHTEPGIYVDKICKPDIFGGQIHCAVTVTNIGETASAPIDIWDAATILFGPGAGGGVMIAGVNPDGPDWICSPTPTPNLWCSLPPGSLGPGQTRFIDVWIDTGPLFAAGNFGFRNCAALDSPWDDVACDDGGTGITVTKTAPASCTPGGDCTFNVTIANTGASPFSGNVQLTDGMFLPGGGALAAPIKAMVPALCAPPPGAIGFSCPAPLTLAPGQSVAASITVTMPAAPPAYWAENCFSVSPTGLPVPVMPPAPGVPPTSATSCAWVPVGAPAPLSNIRVQKTASHGGKCYKQPGDVIACDYQIAFINDGPSPFHGNLTFTDNIPPAATLSVFPAPWVCLGAPLTCGTAAPVDIAAGGAMTVPVTVTIPRASLEAAGCGLPDTVTLTAPAAGTNANYFGGDDSATATADAFLTWVLPDGTTLVTCDPTNLKTTKVAKGDCTASGGGYRCEYAVRVTDLGPDPYKGPIKISEQLGFAPGSVTFSAPWGCTGGGAIYQCTYPQVDLKKGDSVELEVTVNVAGEKHCDLKNSAVMTFPTAGTRFNGKAGDDAASASAKIPAKDCAKPERPQCEPGANEFRSQSGACVCNSGYLRDEKGKCVGVVAPKLCPDGMPIPRSGHCPLPPAQCQPGPNEERNDQGQCVCKRGYERNSRGFCAEISRPQDTCDAKGWVWNETTKTCTPPFNPADDCRKRGWMWDGQRCEPPVNPADDCRKRGWVWDGARCEPPVNPADDCRKRGWVWDGERCEPPVNPADDCRKRGWVWSDNECINPPDICRSKGWIWDGAHCINPADNCKERGWTWDGRQCLPPANPGDDCRKKGWVWDGERCKPPVDPADECKKKGWVWTNNACVNPADDCSRRGWVWDGKQCQPKTDPADECRKTGGVWDGRQCKPKANPADECRKTGGVWNGEQCQPKANPADDCRKTGGEWNGKQCKPKSNPADDCRKTGGVWNGEQCQPKANPADDCRKTGGVWNGKKCKPKTDPADECRKTGGVWNGAQCQPKANPADECRKTGGTWDGKQCQQKPKLSGPNPAQECQSKGKVWDGQHCTGQGGQGGKGDQCRSQGGVWDKATKTCQPGNAIPR